MIEVLAIIGASVGALGLVSSITLAYWNRDAERRCADARVDAQAKAGTIAIQAADLVTKTNEAAFEKGRADDLDDVLDEVAASGDAALARARLHAKWNKRHHPDATGSDVAQPVPAPPTPDPAGPEGLLRPGD